jgi:hypothetical protein
MAVLVISIVAVLQQANARFEAFAQPEVIDEEDKDVNDRLKVNR